MTEDVSFSGLVIRKASIFLSAGEKQAKREANYCTLCNADNCNAVCLLHTPRATGLATTTNYFLIEF